MSQSTSIRVAPKSLLCKWYAYTGCKETFDASVADEVKAWKKHVIAHYMNDANLGRAVGREVGCWVRGCAEVLPVGHDRGAPKATLLAMMDHVRTAHMTPPSGTVDWPDLRDDDVTLIFYFWRSAIVPAAEEGLVPWGTLSFWSDSYGLPRVRRGAVPDTGERRGMEAVDEKAARDEARERRRGAAERSKRDGKERDNGEGSSRTGGGK